MKFDDITIVGGPLVLSTSEEIDQAESQLGVTFPTGYREYMTRFGQGLLGGTYIRIYPPKRIINDLDEWRERISQYWFWDEGHDVLTKTQVLETVIIGDTLDGDELIVHPNSPECIYVLPRHSEMIYIAGDGLLSALEWWCSSGILTEPFTERNFIPSV